MSENKKMVEAITPINEDFAQWYTDICLKAELVDYSAVKGCVILRPYGYAIWENIMHLLDKRFKETGHENVAMPLFIPESLLQKEKDHVEGFAPEVAWVTMGGSEKLEDRLCVRPTSETLFCDHFAHVLHSWRTTNGAAWCAGKKRRARSCAAASSGGRRGIPFTRRPRKLLPKQSSS
mgnify:CR=1 FL=1